MYGKNYDETQYIEVDYEDPSTGLDYVISVAVDLNIQEPFNGCPMLCDSDLDFYGFTEVIGWNILEIECFDEDNEEITNFKVPDSLEVTLDSIINDYNFN